MTFWFTVFSVLCATSAAYVNGLKCIECLSESWEECEQQRQIRICAANEVCFTGYSLHTDGKEVPRPGVGRGCGVKNAEATICRSVNHILLSDNPRRFMTFCNVSTYCDSNLCNKDRPSFVFPEVKCKSCMGILSEKNCSEKEKMCRPGLMHCFEVSAMVTNGKNLPQLGFAKGCTYCPTVEIGCVHFNETLKGMLDGNYMKTCNMKCCLGDSCNAMKPKLTTRSGGPMIHSALGGIMVLVLFFSVALH